MQVLDVAFWRQAVAGIADAIGSKKDYLCELDGAIGDGDHGASMMMGFRQAADRLGAEFPGDIGALLETVGNTFTATVGGVTGIVFGTLFTTAGKEAAGKVETGTDSLAAMFRAGLDTVKSRGRANEGDKSMVDALSPAVSALEAAASAGESPAQALKSAAVAAAQGATATADMLAKVGRARYQGENALGHIDAGAASVAVIFESLASTANSLSP